MRWSWISKSLIQVQKEEKSSLIELYMIELIHVFASPQKREIMQAFSRGSLLAVTAKKCTKKCQRCTCNCFAKKANCCFWRSSFSVVIASAFIFWKQRNYLFSLDSRAWRVLQLPFEDKLEVAAWSLPNCDEGGVEIDEMFTELLALAPLGLGLNDVLTTSLERLFFKSPPSCFFNGEKYSLMDFCWELGSDLFGFFGTGFLSFEEGLFREAILKAQMSRANNILAIKG